MSTIHIRGPWAYIWGTWHVAWFAGLGLALWQGPDFAAWYYVALFLSFLPLEAIGLKDLMNDEGDEIAKQLSQWPQWVAQFANEGSTGWLGWKLLAASFGLAYGIVVAASVAHLAMPQFGDLGLAAGVFMGIAIAGWLMPHFGWREVFG